MKDRLVSDDVHSARTLGENVFFCSALKVIISLGRRLRTEKTHSLTFVHLNVLLLIVTAFENCKHSLQTVTNVLNYSSERDSLSSQPTLMRFSTELSFYIFKYIKMLSTVNVFIIPFTQTA